MKNEHLLDDPIVANYALSYRPRFYWYEVYTLGRRFALTSAVLAFPDLGSTTVYVVGVALLFLLLDREWSAHIDPLHSSFAHILNCQVLLAQIYMVGVVSARWGSHDSSFLFTSSPHAHPHLPPPPARCYWTRDTSTRGGATPLSSARRCC